MHQIINAVEVVVRNAANVNHAVLCGHAADCIDTTTKRLLGRKRTSSLVWQLPAASSLRSTYGRQLGEQCPAPTGLGRPVMRTFAEPAMRPWQAGEAPASAWAALVITRALSS